MNHFYRLIWNTSLGCWSAAGENSRRHGKTGRALIGAGSALALSLSGNAWSAELVDFNPYDNDHQAGAVIISGGSSDTLTGSASQFATGKQPGYSTTYGALEDAGMLAEGSASVKDSYRLNLGGQVGVAAPDPITGGNSIIAVYDSSSINESSYADSYIVGYKDVGDAMYIDARVGTVDSTGGTLNVDIGDAGQSVSSADNSIDIRAKQTALFHADGSGDAASTVVWNSRNSVDFGGVLQAPADSVVNRTLYTPVYAGTITAFDGSSHTVDSVEGLRSWNDWLVQQVQAGNLSSSDYQKEFGRAYSTETRSVSFDFGLTDDGADEGYIENKNNAVIYASGANATGRVAEGAQIDARMAGLDSSNGSAVMRADSGATIINDGMMASLSLAVNMMVSDEGSEGINNGVMSAGFVHGDGLPDTAQPTQVSDFAPFYTEARSVYVNNGGSFTNNGIMNVAASNNPGTTRQGFGIIVQHDGSSAVNNGIINVGINNDGSNPNGSVGVSAYGGASFINEVDGEIYLGRAAQYNVDAPESVADTHPNTVLWGIRAGSNSNVENKGTITLGTGVENAQAISAGYNNETVAVTNSGTININGQANDAPLLNVGIYAGNANTTRITNTGEINLNGVNAVGLMAVGKGTPSTITSVGTININGAADPVSGTRNFGAWAEGNGGQVNINGGAINLAGDGAIGVHARDQGHIKVGGGEVNFESGTNQIGYFAYGDGSSIDISTGVTGAVLDVSTEDSTLFRIEDGAQIMADGTSLVASGAGSTALQITGEGSVANLDALNISVTGQDATALKIEGGATGSSNAIGDNSSLTLNDGSVAVVVDDTKYDLTGAAVGSGDSVFTNTGAINVADAQDVTLFRVKNGAELINSGNIDLADGTAVELSGAGSQMKPNASGVAGTITVHDGVAGIHVMDGATLDTSNDITVDGGASGVLIAADAGEVVINSDAHITGLGSGYGNLITSQAAQATTLVDGAVLEMKGSGAAILSESNLNQASHGQVLVSSEVGGKGISLSNADGSVSDGSLSVGDGWDIDVTGNGAGLYANTTGNLTVDTAIDVSGTGNAVLADAAGNVLVDTGAVLRATNADAVLVQG
ncbi:ESPR domain-containing protein, partial [Halomonas huangheensis]